MNWLDPLLHVVLEHHAIVRTVTTFEVSDFGRMIRVNMYGDYRRAQREERQEDGKSADHAGNTHRGSLTPMTWGSSRAGVEPTTCSAARC